MTAFAEVHVRAALAAVSILGWLPAQQVPTPAELARKTHDLVQRLGKAEGQELAAAKQELQELVKAMQGDGYACEHYVEVSSALLQEQPNAALDVANSGLSRHPDSRFLHDHVGYAQTRLATLQGPSLQQQQALQAAEAAFRKALPLQPDTMHAHLGLYQVLGLLDRPDAALQELELALKYPEGEQALTFVWMRRAWLLLQAGKIPAALEVLQGTSVPGEDQPLARILLVRAHALAGDAAKAQQVITRMLEDEDANAATAAAVDALLYLNKKADALKLLQQRPYKADKNDDDHDAAIRRQSFAALEALAKAGDLLAAPTRAALTKALDHHFVVMDSQNGKPRQLDLSASPVMMAQLLMGAEAADPESSKGWANHILLALSLRAQDGYKAPVDEAKVAAMLQKANKFPNAEDLPAALAALRMDIGNPHVDGALMARRVCERLSDKKPAKK